MPGLLAPLFFCAVCGVYGSPITVVDRPGSLDTVSAGTDRIEIRWVDYADNEDGFRLERRGGPNGMWSRLATLAADMTAYSDTNLAASTWYWYRVCAYNSERESAYSPESACVTWGRGGAVEPFLAGAWPGSARGGAQDVHICGDYAYIAIGTGGLVILDVSDPASPRLAGGYQTGGIAVGVHVSGKYAYVADRSAGLFVIDVGNPSAPALVGGTNTAGSARGVYVMGDYAYVADGVNGLQVYDVSRPAAPTHVGGCAVADEAKGVFVRGDVAYVADNSAGLQTINVSDPSNCVDIGGYNTAGYAYGVYVSGAYAYVADNEGGLQVIEVSNPTNCVWVGGYDTSGEARDVYVSGEVALVADRSSGLQIVDVSDPTNCAYRATFDTRGNALGVCGFGIYAFVADDEGAGLQVVDITDAANPVDAGHYSTSGSAQGVTLAGNLAYLADGNCGLRVLDVSDATRPVALGEYKTDGQAVSVCVPGTNAYLAVFGGGLQVLDVSDPAAPAFVGGYSTNADCSDVAVSGQYAYLTVWDSGLLALDVSDPATPAYLDDYVSGSYGVNGLFVRDGTGYVAQAGGMRAIDVTDPENLALAGTHVDIMYDGYDVHVDGAYAYLTIDMYLRVLDAGNIGPTVGELELPGWLAMGLCANDGYAYVADDDGGLQVIDVSDPANPAGVAAYDTWGNALGVAVEGRYAYVADGANGLLVMDLVRETPVVTASDGSHPDKVRVIWTAVSNATGYAVWRHTTADTNGATRVADGLATNVYDDTSAAQSLLYYYWAQPVFGATTGTFSSADTGYLRTVVGLTVDAAPVPGSIDAGGAENWYSFVAAVSNVYTIETVLDTLSDNYMTLHGPDTPAVTVMRADDGGEGKAAKIVQSLLAGAYYVKVRAYSTSQTGTYTIRVTSPPNAPPSGLLAGAVSSSQIDVGWLDNSVNETGFELERKTGAGGVWMLQATVEAGVTNYSDTALPKGTEYYYRVRAFNANGTSSYSGEASATTLEPPDAPSGLTRTEVSPTRNDLAWLDNSDNETGFALERKAGMYGRWAQIDTVGANVTNCTDEGFLADTYFYRLRAYNADGYSRYAYQVDVNNAPEIGVATQELYLACISELVVLDASPSYDPDGDALFFSWRELPGNPHFGLVPAVAESLSKLYVYCPVPGLYTFEVRVSDGLEMSVETRCIRVHVPGLRGKIDLDTGGGLARIPDVRISAHPTVAEANTNATPLDVMITDSYGDYLMEWLCPTGPDEPATFYLRIERLGFETSVKPVEIGAEPDWSDAADFSLSRGLRPYELTGMILDTNSVPLTNATVEILGLGNAAFSTSVDSNALFSFSNVPYGSCSMQIRAPGHRAEVRDVNVCPGLGRLYFHMEPGAVQDASLQVNVTLPGTDVPVEGAQVSLGLGTTEETGAEGVCTYPSLYPGAYVVSVAKTGYESVRLPYVDVVPGTNTLAVALARARQYVMRGTVRDSWSGSPVCPATVGIVKSGNALLRSDVADRTGYFQLDDIPAGAQTVSVEAPGYVKQSLDIETAGDVYTDVELLRAANWKEPELPPTNAPVAQVAEPFIFLTNLLHGALLDGSPSTGDNLKYEWREAPDNPALDLLPAGTETMSNIQVNAFSVPGIYIFELQVKSGNALSANTACIMVFAPGLAGNVHASPSDGAIGLDLVTVRAYPDYADALDWAESGYADSKVSEGTPNVGKYVLDGLSTGCYWVVARAQAGTEYQHYGPVLRRVNYSSGARRAAVNLARDEYDFEGFICDSALRPLENVRVIISLGSLAETYRTSTDAKGIFRLSNVPAGNARFVMFVKEGYKTVVRSVSIFQNRPPYQQKIEDQAATGGPAATAAAPPPDDGGESWPPRQVMEETSQSISVSGTIKTQRQGADYHVAHAEVVLGGGFARTFTDGEGNYEIKGIPPGAYFGIVRKQGYRTADVSDAGGYLIWTNTTNPGVDKTLQFVERGATMRGLALGKQHQVTQGVSVQLLTLSSQKAQPKPNEEEEVLSDEAGIFQLTDVPDGERLVRIEFPDGSCMTSTVFVAGTTCIVASQAEPSSLPYTWKETYFPGSTNENEYADGADPDEDGLDNWGEFVAGTDPTNQASRLLSAFGGVPAGSVEIVIGEGVTGRLYDVDFCTNLIEGFWQDYGLYEPGGGTQLVLTVTNQYDNCFYRTTVRLQD